MTTDSDRSQDPVGPVIDDALLDRLMAQVDEEGLELLGPDGVLTELTSRIMNRALEVGMTDLLGYERGDTSGSGNVRNGSYPKTAQVTVTSFPRVNTVRSNLPVPVDEIRLAEHRALPFVRLLKQVTPRDLPVLY